MKNKLYLYVIVIFTVIAIIINIMYIQSDVNKKLLKLQNNKEIESVELLDLYGDIFDKLEILIKTKNGHSIILYDLKSSLKNKDFSVYAIDDLSSFGGFFRDKYNKKKFHSPRDIRALSIICDLKIESVNDVIDNSEKLYLMFNDYKNKDMYSVINDRYLFVMEIQDFDIEKYKSKCRDRH